MNITKHQMTNALIEARSVLTLSIRSNIKLRNGFCGKFFRSQLREQIAAYRILSNLATIEATTYTHSERDLARIKKALAK